MRTEGSQQGEGGVEFDLATGGAAKRRRREQSRHEPGIRIERSQ